MKILIVGAGTVGAALYKTLRQHTDLEIEVVDADPAKATISAQHAEQMCFDIALYAVPTNELDDGSCDTGGAEIGSYPISTSGTGTCVNLHCSTEILF